MGESVSFRGCLVSVSMCMCVSDPWSLYFSVCVGVCLCVRLCVFVCVSVCLFFGVSPCPHVRVRKRVCLCMCGGVRALTDVKEGVSKIYTFPLSSVPS